MDYTLAQYTPHFDQLAFQATLKKLVYDLGYPEVCAPTARCIPRLYLSPTSHNSSIGLYSATYLQDILLLQYTHNRFTRGLVIDKENGNIIKMDKHRYVRKAFHGHCELTSAEVSCHCSICRHSGRVNYCLLICGGSASAGGVGERCLDLERNIFR